MSILPIMRVKPEPGPSAPDNLTAVYGMGSIGLAWEPCSEADVVGYRVYRANVIDGEYELIEIVNGKDSITCSDNTVQAGVTYFYKVAGFDTFNQAGEYSNTASAAAVPDSVPPAVISIQPDPLTILGANAVITVTAEDNTALSTITLEYDDNGVWREIDTLATLDTAVFNWSTKPLSGNVEIRAIARDSAGNASDGGLKRLYVIDNTGPDVIGLRGTGYGGDIVLE